MPTTAALSNYPLYTGDTTGFKIIANDSGETTTHTVTKETLLVGLATTGSNTFKGTQTHSGSIIPAVDNAYDLGSPTYQWRDVYISSGSLYIDGTKVISSTTQELQITTDNGQSFKILESGSDTITLQSADGNITLTSSGGGDVIMDPNTGIIALKGTTTIYSGNKIVSSDGNSIQFGNGVAITGSIVATGTNLISGSSQISFTGLSGVPSGIISASAQLDALGYSTTSSFNAFTNSFNAAISLSGTTTTLKGNLIVQGTTTQVDSTTVNISDNIIQLNGTGATNAGLVVRDATSPTLTSGSLLWDTTNDKWIAGTLGSEDDVVLRTATQTLTNKTISGASNTISNIGNSSLTNSSISIAGNSISLGGSISAATILSSTGVISGSAQLPSGTVSGSSQIDLTSTTNYSSGIKTRLNAENVLSSSAQVVSALPAGTVSGSSQITFGSISSIPSGLVSGSSQVLAGTTIHSGSFFNGISVVSGSSQVSFNGITDKPALVSGSSQITYNGISSIPSGIVSGSSQITFSGISSIPSGLVSGSSQITFGSISSIPSGLVSGSSQITLSSTTGYGSVLNQAVLTTSTPTFAGLTLGTEFTSNDVNGYSRFTESNGSAQVGLFRSGTSSGGVYIGGDSDFFRIYTSNFGTVLMSVSQSTGAISGSSFTGAGTGLTGTASSLSIGGNAATVTNGVYTTGDQTIAGIKTFSGSITFGSSTRQMITLWGSVYGIGVQSGTQYYRADENFAWFRDGVHSDTAFDPGSGGVLAMKLDASSNLTVTGTIAASNYSGTHSGTSSGTNTGDQTNITGNAGTVTNGVYTTGNQTIGGTKTFSSTTIVSLAGFAGIEYYNATAQWQGYIGTENNTGNLRYNSFNGTHTWYSNGTQTMAVNGSGQLSLSGSNSSSAPLVNLTATGTGTFQRGVRLLNSGMNAGDHIMMAVGQADGARNMGQFYFQYNGAGSTSNRLSLGLHSVDDVFNIWGNGNVEIGSTFNSGYKLDVAGQIRAYAGSSLIVSMSTVATNDAVVAARWTSGTGLEMRYNPNSALCYIDSTYPLSSGQVYGDIHIRQNVGGTMTSRMTFKAETGHILPGANGTQNLGSSSLRWNTVFTSDLSLSNGIGDYTIVEGENDLFLYNNKQNKVYKFMLQEVNAEDATPKRPE